MDDRDLAFDILMELADYTLERGLPKTSMRIEAAMDAFLEETGRAQRERQGGAPSARKLRPRPTLPRVSWVPAR